MNIEEKRRIVSKYCGKTLCDTCKLRGKIWSTNFDGFTGTCLLICDANENDLDKALEIIGYKNVSPKTDNIISKLENEINKIYDPVNHPAHYTDGKIEVIDFITDKKLGFCLGNAVKYIARAGKKDPTKEIEDLQKAVWYINRRIKDLEENQTK